MEPAPCSLEIGQWLHSTTLSSDLCHKLCVALALIRRDSCVSSVSSNQYNVLQLSSVGGMVQLSPTESPCLADTTKLIGKQDSNSFYAVDDTAQPPRLYTLNQNGWLAWYNVTLMPELDASAAGCLADHQKATFTDAVPLPAYQAPASLLPQPEAQSFDLAITAPGLTVPMGAVTTGANGVMFIAGRRAPAGADRRQVPAEDSLNGTDAVKMTIFTIPYASSVHQLLYHCRRF
jgi:hypothetical protein